MRVNPNKPNIGGVLGKLAGNGGINYGEDPRETDKGIASRINRFADMPEVRAQASKDRMDVRGKRKRPNREPNKEPNTQVDNKVLLNKILNKGDE